MTIEEKIAEEAVNAAWNQFQRMPSSNPSDYAHAVTRALSPLLNRVRAEAAVQALREAADEIEMNRNEPGLVKLDVQYAGYYTGIRSGMESAVRAIRNRIEQNSEGSE